MRIAVPLLFAMIFTLTSVSEGQEGKEHLLKVHAGINDYANKDQMVSPFVYTDINYPLHIAYDVRNSVFIRSFEVSYFKGTASTDTDNTRETYSGYMRLGYLRSVSQPLDNFTIYAGGRIGAETIADQASFTTSQKSYVTNSSGYFALSSGITANMKYQLSEVHSFTFNPYVSVLGFIYRPGYSLYHHSSFSEALKSADFSSYGNFLNMTGTLEYQIQLSKLFDLSLNYHFNYLRYARPFEVRVLQNSMTVGLGVTL